MTTPDDKFYRAKIVKRVDYAPDLWMIRINPGGEFQFAPGQYATLGLDGPEKRSERPYSIASSPHEKEIEFFFELVPNGELTPELYTLQLGDELLMRKVPKGRFTLDTGHSRHTRIARCEGNVLRRRAERGHASTSRATHVQRGARDREPHLHASESRAHGRRTRTHRDRCNVIAAASSHQSQRRLLPSAVFRRRRANHR